MITYNDINALPTSGVTLTLMTNKGIQVQVFYECHTSTRLAEIITGTVAAMQHGDVITSVAVV